MDRIRRLLAPFGFVLNLRRVWILILIWAVLANFAFQTQRDLFFRLSYLIVIVVAVSFAWAWYSIYSFRVERRLITPHTQVSRLAEERFRVISTGRLPKLFVELDDYSDLPGHRPSRVLSALSPRVHYTWDVRTLCLKRGRYRLGPLTVGSGDPFGLFLFRRAVPNSTFGITVYPLVLDLPTFAPPLGYLRGGETVRRRTHFVTTNVAGTREYVPGDSFNRIHWPSTARHDRLIVKEFELDPTADVWLFLDMERAVHQARPVPEEEVTQAATPGLLWEPRKPFKLAPSTEEYAVTLAASISKYFLDRQRSVGMVTFGEHPIIIQPDRGERQLPRVLETLAVLEARGSIPFSHLLATESAHLPHNLTLVLITPSTDGDWIRYAAHLERIGQRLIVILLDVATFGSQIDTRGAIQQLATSGILTYRIREGDDLRAALNAPLGARRAA